MKSPRVLLLALLAGLGLGLAVRFSGQPALLALVTAAKPIGTLWLNALKMTLVPLVFAMVASSVIASAVAGSGGRMLGRALALFLLLLAAAAVIGMVALKIILHFWPLPADALAGLALAPVAAPVAIPSIPDQIITLVPTNPVAAAAAGQMMPLVIFALIFGLAAARIARAGRSGLAVLLKDLTDIMLVIVDWVLWAAPIGIFVLALGLAQTAGAGMAALLGQFMILQCGISIVAIAACYGLVALTGAEGVRRFALAAAGPQAMAAGTTSSMATLPAMLEAAERGLGVPERVVGTVLPLAVSIFRFGSVVTTTSAVLIATYAAGLHPSFGQMAALAVVIILSNMSMAGLPATAILYAVEAPAFQLMGAPIELLPLFVAVIAIPDIFITTANVTADLAVVAIIGRFAGRREQRSADQGPALAFE
jgi:Na+/H+-dicarboxylate symporter